MSRFLFCIILILLTSPVLAKDTEKVVILFDQSTSVLPRNNTAAQQLMEEINQAIKTFFTDENIDKNVWSIRGKAQHFQSVGQLLLIRFGGTNKNNCMEKFPSQQLDEFNQDQITNFYSLENATTYLRNSVHESLELAKWQAWKRIKGDNESWDYYQILVTDGRLSQGGPCRTRWEILERENEWILRAEERTLFVLNHNNTLDLRIIISRVSSTSLNLTVVCPALGNLQNGDISSPIGSLLSKSWVSFSIIVIFAIVGVLLLWKYKKIKVARREEK